MGQNFANLVVFALPKQKDLLATLPSQLMRPASSGYRKAHLTASPPKRASLTGKRYCSFRTSSKRSTCYFQFCWLNSLPLICWLIEKILIKKMLLTLQMSSLSFFFFASLFVCLRNLRLRWPTLNFDWILFDPILSQFSTTELPAFTPKIHSNSVFESSERNAISSFDVQKF